MCLLTGGYSPSLSQRAILSNPGSWGTMIITRRLMRSLSRMILANSVLALLFLMALRMKQSGRPPTRNRTCSSFTGSLTGSVELLTEPSACVVFEVSAAWQPNGSLTQAFVVGRWRRSNPRFLT